MFCDIYFFLVGKEKFLVVVFPCKGSDMKKLFFWGLMMVLLVLATGLVAERFLPTKEVAALAFGTVTVTLLLLLIWYRNAVIIFPTIMASIATFIAWTELSGIIPFFYTAVAMGVGVMLVGSRTKNTLKLDSLVDVVVILFVEAVIIFWIFPH